MPTKRTRRLTGVSEAVRFFYIHAGWSYNPARETSDKGRRRCASELAMAESCGRPAGLSFEWSIDPDVTSEDWSDERPAWRQWQCHCFDRRGESVGYLGGIDFGPEGSPSGDPYTRVVEAELAREALS